MRTEIVLLLAALAAVCIAGPLPKNEKYTNRYDHLDVDSILGNRRALDVYIKCVVDQGPCPPEGRELRAHIPEAVATSCDKCTDSQKTFIRKASKYLIKNRPDDWKKITDFYDKEGTYTTSFDEFVNGS